MHNWLQINAYEPIIKHLNSLAFRGIDRIAQMFLRTILRNSK